MALIDVRAVTKIYQDDGVATEALKGINLTIESGEFVSIIGPSGSGKSTLLHILGLLDKPTGGHYIFDGHDVTTLEDQELANLRNSRIGFVFQSFNLLSRTTVLDNVLLPLQYSSVPKKEWLGRAKQALQTVNMGHRLDHFSNQLSGGEKQRVAIARALVNNPKIIFADEPTGNLDTVNGKSVIEVIDKLHDQGHTIVLITHETSAAQQAERIVTVTDGLVVSDSRQEKHKVEFAK